MQLSVVVKFENEFLFCFIWFFYIFYLNPSRRGSVSPAASTCHASYRVRGEMPFLLRLPHCRNSICRVVVVSFINYSLGPQLSSCAYWDRMSLPADRCYHSNFPHHFRPAAQPTPTFNQVDKLNLLLIINNFISFVLLWIINSFKMVAFSGREMNLLGGSKAARNFYFPVSFKLNKSKISTNKRKLKETRHCWSAIIGDIDRKICLCSLFFSIIYHNLL